MIVPWRTASGSRIILAANLNSFRHGLVKKGVGYYINLRKGKTNITIFYFLFIHFNKFYLKNFSLHTHVSILPYLPTYKKVTF